MLKIKDDLDLKELERFGFRYIICYNGEELLFKSKYKEKDVIEVKVDIKTRIIELAPFHDLFNTQEDTLYDLISAGLVEKVSD
jgi:hypothetical protein